MKGFEERGDGLSCVVVGKGIMTQSETGHGRTHSMETCGEVRKWGERENIPETIGYFMNQAGMDCERKKNLPPQNMPF